FINVLAAPVNRPRETHPMPRRLSFLSFSQCFGGTIESATQTPPNFAASHFSAFINVLAAPSNPSRETRPYLAPPPFSAFINVLGAIRVVLTHSHTSPPSQPWSPA